MNRLNAPPNSHEPFTAPLEKLSAARLGYFMAATAVSIILFFIVSQLLKQYPRYIPDPDTMLAPGWTIFTDKAQTYTFNLPPRWVVREENVFQADDLVIEQRSMETAVSIFKEIDDSLEAVLIAHADDNTTQPGFILIAKNLRMHQVPPSELIHFLQENNPAVLRAETNSSFDRLQANLYTELVQSDGERLLCLQQFTPTSETGFIFIGCAGRTVFGNYRDDLESIQASFQPLQ